MRRHLLSISVGLLLVLVGAWIAYGDVGFAAHGAIQGEFAFGQLYAIHLVFSVHDTGPELEDDFGSLSIRLSAPGTGKPIYVIVATRVYNVHLASDGSVGFVATLRKVRGPNPLPQENIQFWAYDGGAADWFQMGMAGYVTIERGNIVLKLRE